MLILSATMDNKMNISAGRELSLIIHGARWRVSTGWGDIFVCIYFYCFLFPGDIQLQVLPGAARVLVK